MCDIPFLYIFVKLLRGGPEGATFGATPVGFLLFGNHKK